MYDNFNRSVGCIGFVFFVKCGQHHNLALTVFINHLNMAIIFIKNSLCSMGVERGKLKGLSFVLVPRVPF